MDGWFAGWCTCRSVGVEMEFSLVCVVSRRPATGNFTGSWRKEFAAHLVHFLITIQGWCLTPCICLMSLLLLGFICLFVWFGLVWFGCSPSPRYFGQNS